MTGLDGGTLSLQAWAGGVPERLEVAECGVCAALVSSARLDLHLRWHRAHRATVERRAER